ncbi:hypothetical protein Bhyg_12107, partial [Pseudolycoriella hygida]
MTWYWWTHWFWITSLSATISCYSFGSLDTSPSSTPFNHGKIYNKGEPLKFPIAVQSDSDDIIDGRELLEAKFNDEWITADKRLRNLEKDEQELKEFDKNETALDIQGVRSDYREDNSSKGMESAVNDVTGLKKNNSSLIKTTEIENIQNSIKSNIPITKISQVNVSTVAPRVEKITKLKSISTKSQSSRPEVTVKRQNESEYTTEPEIVREETENQVISDRGRQSKILAEYSESIKILNLTSASKNLLARSAVSITSDEIVGDDELNSEALIIKRATILDAGAISGICLGVIGLSCVVSAIGVMVYRRRYVNKPQTLSEPDSSGYIDDSTIRDNSDEMYSLDNDSFLNSLEAMTIQNYWTDNMRALKAQAALCFEEYCEPDEFCYMAAMFDPRYKSLKFAPPETREKAIDMLERLVALELDESMKVAEDRINVLILKSKLRVTLDIIASLTPISLASGHDTALELLCCIHCFQYKKLRPFMTKTSPKVLTEQYEMTILKVDF